MCNLLFADCVHVLLQNGADANAVRDDGRTTIHLAAANGHIRCVLFYYTQNDFSYFFIL